MVPPRSKKAAGSDAPGGVYLLSLCLHGLGNGSAETDGTGGVKVRV